MRLTMLGLVMMAAAAAMAAAADMPPPFTRELAVQTPPQTGSDVEILQHLLNRTAAAVSGAYDAATAAQVRSFQTQHQLTADGVVGPATAAAVLEHLAYDGYVDDGAPPAASGHLYKVHLRVERNRSVEVTARLLDKNNQVLYNFTVRAHGRDADNVPRPWPDFNNSNDGLNMFSPDGNTPTGLMTFDLNAPEPDPKSFGPYPVNRAVSGLRGNAVFLVPHVRNGILLHTGEWPGWQPPMPMPNSEGCIHSWPEHIERIWHLLVGLGVEVRPNSGGALPYPHVPQGLLSVESAPYGGSR